jgi:hypothetical protein
VGIKRQLLVLPYVLAGCAAAGMQRRARIWRFAHLDAASRHRALLGENRRDGARWATGAASAAGSLVAFGSFNQLSFDYDHGALGRGVQRMSGNLPDSRYPRPILVVLSAERFSDPGPSCKPGSTRT